MAKTLASGTALLCPATEFLARMDYQSVAELASDSGTPENPATAPRVLAALRDASGDVEAAALLGGRYTADDLGVILGTDCNARGKLYRIVSDIAWVYLWEGRSNKDLPTPPSYQRSLLWLKELAQGTAIFGLQETMDAGLMTHDVETAVDVENRNGATLIACRLFGIRGNREGRTQGG